MSGPRSVAFSRRHTCLGVILVALVLAGCATGPRIPPYVLGPGAPVSAEAGDGFVVLGARRLSRDGCRDRFGPAITITAPQGQEVARRGLFFSEPEAAGWVPDASRPGAIRRVYLLKLPAGSHAVTGWGYLEVNGSSSTSFSAETRPWQFEVAAGRVTYVGGLGIAPLFFDGLFECRTGRGSVFQFSDPANDIALARQLWPELNGMDIVDRSARPAGWQRGPVGFD